MNSSTKPEHPSNQETQHEHCTRAPPSWRTRPAKRSAFHRGSKSASSASTIRTAPKTVNGSTLMSNARPRRVRPAARSRGYLVLALLAPTGMEILVPRVRQADPQLRPRQGAIPSAGAGGQAGAQPHQARRRRGQGAAAAGCFRSRTRSRSRAATSRRWWPLRSRWCSAERRRTTHHGHQHRLRGPRPHHRRGRRQACRRQDGCRHHCCCPHHGRGGRRARCRQDRQHRHRCRHARREEGAQRRGYRHKLSGSASKGGLSALGTASDLGGLVAEASRNTLAINPLIG